MFLQTESCMIAYAEWRREKHEAETLVSAQRLWRLVGALAAGSCVLQKRAVVEAAGVQAPRFEVDPMWPKPLPEPLGDRHRDRRLGGCQRSHLDHPSRRLARSEGTVRDDGSRAAAECCAPAPPVLEFDEAGDLIGHWGGPGEGYDWPASNHGIDVDYKGNVWIGGNGRGAQPAALPGATRARWARGSAFTTAWS